MNLRLRDLGRSRDQFKAYYLFLQKVFDHPTWQVGDLWLEETTYELIWFFDKVVVFGKVVKKCNIFSLARCMAMKLGKLMIYDQVNAPIKSHVLLATWLHKVTWKNKNGIFLPPEDLWQGADKWQGKAHNETSRDHKRSRLKLKT